MRKKETLLTRKLCTLQKIIICQSVGMIICEILNEIAKQLLKMLNKCFLFVSKNIMHFEISIFFQHVKLTLKKMLSEHFIIL